MAALSGLLPTAPVDVGARLRPLPEAGAVPGAPGWRWRHTPGHAPGHVSPWRQGDRALVSGDVVITTRQQQAPEMHGPPAYVIPDWDAAEAFARALATFEPALVLPGHGQSAAGPAMRAALNRLAETFRAVAVPEGGRTARPGGGPEREPARLGGERL